MANAKVSSLSAPSTNATTLASKVHLADASTDKAIAVSEFAAFASWGEPVMEWAFGDASSTNVIVASPLTNVYFKNLSGYRHLLLVGFGLKTDTGTTDRPMIRTSTDNGSTFASTSYDNYGITGTSASHSGAAAASTETFMIWAEFVDFNVTARKTRILHSQAQLLSATGRLTCFCERAAELNNALQLLTLSGANFTAGNLRLYGRKG